MKIKASVFKILNICFCLFVSHICEDTLKAWLLRLRGHIWRQRKSKSCGIYMVKTLCLVAMCPCLLKRNFQEIRSISLSINIFLSTKWFHVNILAVTLCKAYQISFNLKHFIKLQNALYCKLLRCLHYSTFFYHLIESLDWPIH